MGEQQNLVEVEESAFQNLLNGALDLIDDCPGLDIGPDRWLTQKIKDLGDSLRATAAKEWAEAEKYRKLHSPEIEHFLTAVENEALYQRARWSDSGDAGKSDADWFWLLGFLAGKAIRPDATPEKRLHHIITTAAACLNWHAARTGAYVSLRPGIASPTDVQLAKVCTEHAQMRSIQAQQE